MVNLPLPPLALAWFAKTQPKHLWLDAIVAKYGQQCRDAALEEAAQVSEQGFKFAHSGYEIADSIRSIK